MATSVDGPGREQRRIGASAAVAEGPSTARGRRTRGALVEAARELFEERGFRETRISDIAERSRTSYGTFYHYFESKDAVLHELFTAVAGEMFRASQTPHDAPHDPLARVEAANRQYFAAAKRNAGLIAVIDEMAIRDPTFRELKLQLRNLFLHRNEKSVRRLQEAGLADPGLDPVLAAEALGGMVEHLTEMMFVHSLAIDEEAAVATLTRLWANALGLAPAHQGERSAP